ncbi:hypothetical protein FAQ84_15285, partial [Klebsiella pneumoniae subsp. pneumoniae]
PGGGGGGGGRGGLPGALTQKTPPPPNPRPAAPPPPPPFFIRFCTARQSWRGYSGVLIQAWSSSQVKSHFRSGPAITFR